MADSTVIVDAKSLDARTIVLDDDGDDTDLSFGPEGCYISPRLQSLVAQL